MLSIHHCENHTLPINMRAKWFVFIGLLMSYGCAYYNPAINPVALLSDVQMNVLFRNQTGEDVELFYDGVKQGTAKPGGRLQFSVRAQKENTLFSGYRGKGSLRIRGLETHSEATVIIVYDGNTLDPNDVYKMAYMGNSVFVRHESDSENIYIDLRSHE